MQEYKSQESTFVYSINNNNNMMPNGWQWIDGLCCRQFVCDKKTFNTLRFSKVLYVTIYTCVSWYNNMRTYSKYYTLQQKHWKRMNKKYTGYCPLTTHFIISIFFFFFFSHKSNGYIIIYLYKSQLNHWISTLTLQIFFAFTRFY